LRRRDLSHPAAGAEPHRRIYDVVTKAHAHFGRLDIVLDNAGYALAGAIEEANEAEVLAEFDTNVSGPLTVIQAVLPLLRAQRSGHIIGVSSVAGVYAGPITGFYHASKWAFEALHESLSKEIAQFGIKVTLLEPGQNALSQFRPQLGRSSQSGQCPKAPFVVPGRHRLLRLRFGGPSRCGDLPIAAVLSLVGDG
jgi:NADP-dependent 3-hydroxy acid dehydrogenase YdfG